MRVVPYPGPGTPSLGYLLAAAYIEGLQRHDAPQEPPSEPVRLDGADRAPVVRLRGTRG